MIDICDTPSELVCLAFGAGRLVEEISQTQHPLAALFGALAGSGASVEVKVTAGTEDEDTEDEAPAAAAQPAEAITDAAPAAEATRDAQPDTAPADTEA